MIKKLVRRNNFREYTKRHLKSEPEGQWETVVDDSEFTRKFIEDPQILDIHFRLKRIETVLPEVIHNQNLLKEAILKLDDKTKDSFVKLIQDLIDQSDMLEKRLNALERDQ